MTAPKVLTEAEAWREIARRFAEGEAEPETGLCYAVLILSHEARITREQYQTMKERIKRHASLEWIWEDGGNEGTTGPWAFPSADTEVRVLAALFLALEAEETA